MSLRYYLRLAFFVIHLLLISLVCCHDTLWLCAEGYTLLPRSLDVSWRRAETTLAALLGWKLPVSNPVRQGIAFYTHGAGTHASYSFFAPNVPSSYKVVFELHYPDGRVESELPRVAADATGLRLISLLDYIGQSRYVALREAMLKMLAYATWREHPDAILVRTVFGTVDLPSAADFKNGETESYRVLYAYDFSFPRVTEPRSE